MVEYQTALNVIKDKLSEEVFDTLKILNHKLRKEDIESFVLIALIHLIKHGYEERITHTSASQIEDFAKNLLNQIDCFKIDDA